MPTNVPAWVANVADITGIVSFFITIILLGVNSQLRKEIKAQRDEYMQQQELIRSVLTGFRDTILKDNLLTNKIRSEIRTELLKHRVIFRKVLTFVDKYRIRQAIRELKKPVNNIDRAVLCEKLDYLIARFYRREVDQNGDR